MRLTRTLRTQPFLFQIIPLLDILLVILVFFVLTSTFVSQPGIKVEPPSSHFTVEPALHSQIISLIGNEQLRIFFHDKLVTEAQLGALLNHKKDSQNATVIVKADRSVTHAQVMNITNLALERGYRVVIAASAPTEP